MPSLKDIKTQINSVGSTKKITSAMKMVAASKLRRSQEKAEAARPYSSRLEEMLSSLASSAASGEGIIKLLTGTGNDQNYIVVPVSADRGLCGGFNSSINRETFKLVKSLEGNRSWDSWTKSTACILVCFPVVIEVGLLGWNDTAVKIQNQSFKIILNW